jgi:predicted Zn-dependent protease
MIRRVAAVSAAILLCAWFVLGANQAHDLSRATAIVQNSGPLSSAQASRVDSLLGSASTLHPDRTIDLLRGIVAQDRNHRSRAVRIFAQVTREEPMNLDAWVYLAQAAGNDKALVQRAVVQIGILDSGVKPVR